ncbi:hypothetical protein GCM10029963_25020 [Micromonospora andamanensis]
MTDSARARVIAALEQVDPDLGAFITVDPDAALRRAAREPGGRLRGLVLAVKDLVDTAGLRTTYGSPRYRYHVPTLTAPVVARLEKEGAIVVGKTNLNEFAYGVSGYNPHYGLMRVPGDRDRTPAGRVAARRSRSRPGCAMSRSAPTPPARCASRRPAAAYSGSSAPTAQCR